MLIPLSWTVSEAEAAPERKREKGKMEGEEEVECVLNRDGEGSGS